MKKTWVFAAILSLTAVLVLSMSVFAEPAGSGAEENLFSADDFLQSYFREDASRPGTFSNGGVTTGSETFETAGLTTHYTFSGHVIVKVYNSIPNGLKAEFCADYVVEKFHVFLLSRCGKSAR